MSDLTLIKASAFKNKSTFSIDESVCESPLIVRAIWEINFSETVRFLIFPLSEVYRSRRIDSMGSLGQPSRLNQRFISDLVLPKGLSGLLNVLVKLQCFLNGRVLAAIERRLIIKWVGDSIVVILHVEIFIGLTTSGLTHLEYYKQVKQLQNEYEYSLYYLIVPQQLIDMYQAFGFNQKPIQDEKWLEIATKMIASPYTRLKNIQYLAEAQHQSRRFANIGNLVGGVLFLAFLKFPLIRIQPGFRRVGLSAGLAYPFYWYMHDLALKLQVKRIKFAYHKQQVQHKGHKRVTV